MAQTETPTSVIFRAAYKRMLSGHKMAKELKAIIS